MPVTEIFYVSTKDNKVRKTTETGREYFVSGGKKEGQAKYLIEVFGYGHEKLANEVRDMVDKGEMDQRLFRIRVETR